MKIVRHLASQPFVVATGFAALIHSTWSLGTFFSGSQPEDPIHYIFWLIPALLIAFSLDIGQIVTSAEIRDGQRSVAKYATFFVFAAATYYLQFMFIASHMPQVQLSAGVRETWGATVSLVRDSGVWIIPALLPLSTLLYTFSQDRSGAKGALTELAALSTATALVPQDGAERVEAELTIEEPVEIECPSCEWSGTYATAEAATNALNGHSRVHQKKSAVSASSNGRR